MPPRTFFSGNHARTCQHDRHAAFSYIAGLFDEAAHAAAVIDSDRNFGKGLSKNDVEVDFALDRVVGYCRPEHANLEQVTDVFCAYLKDSPAERTSRDHVRRSSEASLAVSKKAHRKRY